MSDPTSLMNQLARRAKSWHASTDVSQSLMASACGLDESNYSSFLSGRKGIGSEATCLLLKHLFMPRREVVAKFVQPPLTSKIMLLQERGTRMSFDNDGHVPGQSGFDPVDSGDITDVPDAASQNGLDPATEDLLRQVRGYHRKAANLITEYITKARANRDGSTPPAAQKFSRR